VTLREAIHARLLATSQLTSLLATPQHSVFHRRAPQQAKPPLVIFEKRTGVPRWNYDGELAMNEETWLVRGVAFGRTAERAELIGAAIDVALTDAPLAVDGHHLLTIYRESDVDYPEQTGKEIVQHCGGIYRVTVEPSA
jgi:hypothetical protein